MKHIFWISATVLTLICAATVTVYGWQVAGPFAIVPGLITFPAGYGIAKLIQRG